MVSTVFIRVSAQPPISPHLELAPILKVGKVNMRPSPLTHSSSSLLLVEHKATQQRLPAFTVFSSLFHLIPASPAQVFTPTFHSSSLGNLWSSSLSLAFRGPGESNSAIVVFFPPQDMTYPSPSPNLHGF